MTVRGWVIKAVSGGMTKEVSRIKNIITVTIITYHTCDNTSKLLELVVLLLLVVVVLLVLVVLVVVMSLIFRFSTMSLFRFSTTTSLNSSSAVTDSSFMLCLALP